MYWPSAAYDMMNTDILLQKLEYYGFRNKTYNIMRSYFQDRKQYINLETSNSQLTNSPKGGCIQGSKMSGTIYNLYTNEVPELHRRLHTQMYNKITNKKSHITTRT